ncbi:lysophospholipid acyltransferase family protein [Phytohabitans houttuyneae]|uniref:1-acyl-sn-glycerol-3-phosphate acyltransferase n=1 Tax=Phytohabitans houttuyneae TaxID=1076126 RepID=A0A6V8KUU5_9ACTN|nr:lysophospholipid acyltransferase family protein [Phytohabitans houttuyneae]GFJ84355.1 1-acyl-sn-glycerol-3-phosphate acyltransferase [Phytohabitans houttuyneae]
MALVPFARLRVSGDVPVPLRGGPLILAANHISPIDPAVLMAACRARGVAPRFLADAAVFRLRSVGWLVRRTGHVPVARGTATVTDALGDAAAAVEAGAVVLVYPEGRIGLDPGFWPEKGKTGTARLALLSGAVVIPVAQWGTHELVPYSAPKGAVRGLLRAMRHRPTVHVRFGAPLRVTGTAREATEQIMAAITATLAPLRAAEPDRPNHVDPTRPLSTSRTRPR